MPSKSDIMREIIRIDSELISMIFAYISYDSKLTGLLTVARRKREPLLSQLTNCPDCGCKGDG